MSRARHRFLDELAERFASHGAEPYGEAVSQAEHALQCATLAERAGCSDSLVVAALLHDIGHLYEDPAQIDEEDLRHEEFGARLLRELFPESVWQPVRLHVSAKRFLCAVDPSYHASLSPASRHSLVLQGGPFDERAAAAYIKAPYAQDGLTLRRLDDLAKDPAMRTPELTHFFPLLPLNEEQRAELELLIRDIELKLANEDALNEGSLVDGVNLAVERFEVSHPTLAGTLRSIVQSLANMGI